MKVNIGAFGDVIRSSKHDDMFNCPFCQDTKGHLGVHREKGIFHCFRCGAAGKIEQLGFGLKDFNKIVKAKFDKEMFVKLRPMPISLPHFYQPVTPADKLPYNYLRNRNITNLEIARYQIGYCMSGIFAHRIIIPIYQRAILKYFVGRTYVNDQPKYMNAAAPKDNLIFKTFVGRTTVAIICEGIFDALRVAKVNPAIALLGKQASKGQLQTIKDSAKKAIVLLDEDAKKEGFELFLQLNTYLPTKLRFTVSKDPGSMSTIQIEELLSCEYIKG